MNYATPDPSTLTLDQLRKELIDLEALYHHESFTLDGQARRFDDDVAPIDVDIVGVENPAWWQELDRLHALSGSHPHIRQPLEALTKLSRDLLALRGRILELQAHCVTHYEYMANDAPLQPAEFDLTGYGMVQVHRFERARPRYWISLDTREEEEHTRALYWHEVKNHGPITLAPPQAAYLDMAPAISRRRVPYKALASIGFRGIWVSLDGFLYETRDTPETLRTTFRELARFENIVELQLDFEDFADPIDPALLRPLRKLTRLHAVGVSSDNGPLQPGALDFLTQLPEVQMLSLSNALAPEEFALLHALPALRDLRISNQELPIEALRQIARLPLTRLTLEDVTVPPQLLIETARSLKDLQTLRIEGDSDLKRVVEEALDIPVIGSDPSTNWPYDLDDLMLD